MIFVIERARKCFRFSGTYSEYDFTEGFPQMKEMYKYGIFTNFSVLTEQNLNRQSTINL